MNSIKRQLTISEFSDDRQIKFQKIFDQTKKSINCLENLSNEIFYEIFEYLDGCDIYRTFTNLNSRFRHILIRLSIPLKFNLHGKSNASLIIYEKLIVLLKYRIISLNLNRILKPCSSMLIDSSFNRLESLTLNLSNDQQLNSLSNLSSLPRLFALTLHIHNHIDYNIEIYPKLFSLPKLTYVKLSSKIFSTYDTLSMTTTTNDSLLKRLINDHDCTFNMLLSYLSSTPQLLRLVCKKKLLESQVNILPKLMIKTILTHIYINECYLKFEIFELFIKEISSQLKVLHLSLVYDVTYLDADRWEQFICRYIPYLSRLEFKYTEFVKKNFQIALHHQIIHRFIRPFWIERQWFLHYTIGAGKLRNGMISYYIGPYKYNEKDSLINKYDSSPVQLTLINSMFLRWSKSFINRIKSCLRLFNITHLIFFNHGISIEILLLLIKILSNLNSLFLSSFLLTNKKLISIFKTKTMISQKMNNKITKLYIKRINILEEIQYLIYLCPYINYLEIDDINQINFEEFLQLILIKYRKNLSNYFSFNLRNFQYNEKIIQQLQNIIKNEKLYDNCIFTYTSNTIYLQYKKY